MNINNKKLLEYLIENNGKPEGESWLDLAQKFGITAPNEKRAEVDEEYAKKAAARAVNDVWRSYTKKSFEKVRYTEVNGEEKFATFKQIKEIPDIPLDDFEIDRITTNPYGSHWVKMKKKDKPLDEDNLDKLKESLLDDIKPIRITPEKRNNKTLILYFSDRHIGALTKENSIYTNKYDFDEIVVRNVSKPLEIAIKEHYDNIIVFDLGDALDGFNGKTVGGLRGTSQHTLPQQLNNREQFNTYVKVVKQFFDNLVSNTKSSIYFIATSNSNHGGDFDYTAMKAAEIYLNLKYPNIKTHITDKFIDHLILDNTVIIFSHGKDMEDKKSGLPLTLDTKTENYINDYIINNNLQGNNIHFVSGDLHQASETYGKTFRYRKVLSQYGGSKWIHTNFGTSKPGISYDILDNNTGEIIAVNKFYTNGNEQNTGITL